MIIFGVKLWAWGSTLTSRIHRCGKCQYEGQFVQKQGMNFLTFYWVIPTIPVSGIKQLIQCPNCKSRYEVQPSPTPPPTGGGSPFSN